MKEYLIQLANQVSYAALIDQAEKNRCSIIWGMGVLLAYSPAPYVYELQGSKRGKFLKKAAEPGKNRHYYLKDDQDNIISAVNFAKFVPARHSWIIYRRFYKNCEKHIIEYAFDSAFETDREADINSVHLTEFKEGRASKRYSIYGKDTYVETLYYPEDGNVTLVNEVRYNSTITERTYRIIQDEKLTIIDTTNGQSIQIYPEI